jgi:hypothetical protein
MTTLSPEEQAAAQKLRVAVSDAVHAIAALDAVAKTLPPDQRALFRKTKRAAAALHLAALNLNNAGNFVIMPRGGST